MAHRDSASVRRWTCQSITPSCFQVYYLRGIGKLLQLLDSDDEEVQRVAAGALRNVVYQSSENKMEVKENDGLATILRALKSSRDVETRRELTGQFFSYIFYFWYMIAAEFVKRHIITLRPLTSYCDGCIYRLSLAKNLG